MLSQEYYDDIEQNFFMWNVVWKPIGQYSLHEVFTCGCTMLPRENLKHQGQGLILVQCRLEPQGQHYIGFFLCNVVPGVLRKHCHRTFSGSMLSGASWLGQHCTRFLPLQCCPKGIKITLNKMFSCALLSGASRTTLHWVVTCAMFAHG